MVRIIQLSLLLLVLCLCCAQFHGDNDKNKKGYFQYVHVQAPKEYEFGFRRGNEDHFISRFEQAKGHRFKTNVKWGDKYDGHGEHYWEYNHAPKHHEKKTKHQIQYQPHHDYVEPMHHSNPHEIHETVYL